jgi:hypothetical protein
MIVFAGEPFFGQDRFDQFKWRLSQQGLRDDSSQSRQAGAAKAPHPPR